MTYAIKIAPGNYVAHVYFGKEIPDEDLTWLLRLDENPFTPETNARDKAVYMDTLPFEYPCLGTGDFREHAFSAALRYQIAASLLDLRPPFPSKKQSPRRRRAMRSPDSAASRSPISTNKVNIR